MIYSTEIENMCLVRKGANHDPAQYLKRANGLKQSRYQTFPVLLMESAGAHRNKDAAN